MPSLTSQFNWKIAGFAGQGIKNAGEMFSRLMCRWGWDIYDYTEFPSLIKGGHNTYQVLASTTKAYCQEYPVDLLVCLSKNGLEFHKAELNGNSLVMADFADEKIDPAQFDLPGRLVDVPFFGLAKESGSQQRLIGNTVAIAASAAAVGIGLEEVQRLIADTFAGKDSVIEINRKAAMAGYEFVRKLDLPKRDLVRQADPARISLSGAEAIGLGAIAGGLQFYCAYPMSPSTPILHYLAAKGDAVAMVVKQSEDEIGAVNVALGASFAGVRAMCGTAGGGFCLMTEALGYAGIAELPLVVVLAMRPGPAVGMPTWSSQADLYFAIYASQDEFPRVVLAPGDMQESFELTRRALELAEAFQTPVIILTEKNLTEGRGTFIPLDTSFTNKRFGFIDTPKADETGFFPRHYPTDSGLSFRTRPGQPNGAFISTSYEHDRYGLTSESETDRMEQMKKRFRKFEAMKKAILPQQQEMASGAKLGLISFGATKGVVAAARQALEAAGITSHWLHLSWLWPFPQPQVSKFITACDRLVVVENNFTGQLANLITQQTGNAKLERLNKFDGRPFYPHEIVNYVKEEYEIR